MAKSNVVPVLDDLAKRINEEHGKAEATFKTALAHAMKAGELLAEAKAAVPHGEWLPWIEANCAFHAAPFQSNPLIVIAGLHASRDLRTR